jgi:hypothetical protein
MAYITAARSENGTVNLSDSYCLHCGGIDSLKVARATLNKSTPLQLLAIVPWFLLVPTALGIGFLPYALLLSFAISWAAVQRARVVYQVCGACRRARFQVRGTAALGFLLGFVLLASPGLFSAPRVFLYCGILVVLATVAITSFRSRRFALSLKSSTGGQVRLKVPKEPLPLA